MANPRPHTPLTPAQLAEVKRLATAERRSVGNMLAVLVGEALAARIRPPVTLTAEAFNAR